MAILYTFQLQRQPLLRLYPKPLKSQAKPQAKPQHKHKGTPMTLGISLRLLPVVPPVCHLVSQPVNNPTAKQSTKPTANQQKVQPIQPHLHLHQ